MENYYTMREITEKIGISVSTFYQEKKKNAVFFDANTIKHREEEQSKKKKPINKYSQSVFDFFANKYGQEGSVSVLEGSSSTTNASEKAPVSTPAGEEEPQSKENPSQEKINALESQIQDLKTQIEELKSEKKEINEKLGIALLCLQQAQAENKLLLPAPKKPFIEKVKSIFHRK